MSWPGDATGSPSPSTCVNDMTDRRVTHSDHPDHVRQRRTPAGSAARGRGSCELTVATGGCALAGTCPVRWGPPTVVHFSCLDVDQAGTGYAVQRLGAHWSDGIAFALTLTGPDLA